MRIAENLADVVLTTLNAPVSFSIHFFALKLTKFCLGVAGLRSDLQLEL